MITGSPRRGIPLTEYLPGFEGLAPWNQPRPTQRTPQQEQDRQDLLSRLAVSDLGTLNAQVAAILQDHPETRDSDVALALRYWMKHQPAALEKGRREKLELEVLYELSSFESIARARRLIQNTFELFRGTLETRRSRDGHQLEFYREIAAMRRNEPELRVYLDETGDAKGKWHGVGGIAVADWRLFEMHHSLLTKWRKSLGPQTLHFAEIVEQEDITPYLKLLDQVSTRRVGVVFLWYALPSSTYRHATLSTLITSLVTGAVESLLADVVSDSKPRGIRVIKEADFGFDVHHLDGIKLDLSGLLAERFGERVFLRDVEAVAKGSDVLLELADVIAGASARMAAFRGRNPKDRLADAVENVTGLRTRPDEKPEYRAFGRG